MQSDRADGNFVSVPAHHQRLGKERTSMPDVSSFLRFPDKAQKYMCRDLFREDDYQAHYLVFFTYDREAYSRSEAIWDRLGERWYGELVIFRKGSYGGNLVNMASTRGDTDSIIWKVIDK